MELYTFFPYSASLVVLNVFSLLLSAGNFAALASNIPGKKASSGAKKCGAEGHYYTWGMWLGVRSGDLIDAYTQFFVIPMKLCSWVPLPLCQTYTILAESYWGLNMLAVAAGLVANRPSDPGVNPYPNMVTPIFLLAVFHPLTAVLRCLILFPLLGPTSSTAFLVMLAVWYVICAVHAAVTFGRTYGIGLHTTVRYMNDLWLAHETHMKENDGKWDQNQLHPLGFDPITMGPQTLLAQLRKETGLELATPQALEDHIESFMTANTISHCRAVSFLVASGAFALALPPFLAAIV